VEFLSVKTVKVNVKKNREFRKQAAANSLLSRAAGPKRRLPPPSFALPLLRCCSYVLPGSFVDGDY